MVKAIALHGLGLSIYAGEDLPINQKKDDKNFKFLQAMDEQQERIGDEALNANDPLARLRYECRRAGKRLDIEKGICYIDHPKTL